MIENNTIKFCTTITEINGVIPVISINYINNLNNYIIDYSYVE